MTDRSPIEPFDFGSGTSPYRTTFTLDDRQVPVIVSGAVADDPERAETVARDAVLWVARQLAAIVDFCADRLLDDYNAGWVDDEADRLTGPQFVSRLTTRAIAVEPDGSLLVSLHDQGLFRGHEVIVVVDSEGHLVDVQLLG